MQVKLSALVISAFVTGLVGGIYFLFTVEALPQFAFDPLFDLAVALMAFFGGLGTIAGPVLGAAIIEPLQQYLTSANNNDYLSEILMGILFLAVILLVPRGIIPTVGEQFTKWRARRSSRRPAHAAPAKPLAVPQPAAGPGKEASR
jgi:branched-chain amino acid transport system permease protein